MRKHLGLFLLSILISANAEEALGESMAPPRKPVSSTTSTHGPLSNSASKNSANSNSSPKSSLSLPVDTVSSGKQKSSISTEIVKHNSNEKSLTHVPVGKSKQSTQPKTQAKPIQEAEIRKMVSGQAQPFENEPQDLQDIRAIDATLFPEWYKSSDPIWITDELIKPLQSNKPLVLFSGLPPTEELDIPSKSIDPTELLWVNSLQIPEWQKHLDSRVIRYLHFYKTNPRGQKWVQAWIKKSGKYAGMIRQTLQKENVPPDMIWVSLVESAFEPKVKSKAGAVGLWQFMPEGAKSYGLRVDRWKDERMNPERSTLAAAKYLSDLYQRFGTWELALAAYNMGYGGLLSSIKKYNTNDFWKLVQLEAGLPYETALYVPKIFALSIIDSNRSLFGCESILSDPAISYDQVAVPNGASFAAISKASGTNISEIQKLNPDFVADISPPSSLESEIDIIKVPLGAGLKTASNLSSLVELKRSTYSLKWGETLEDIATKYGISKSSLMQLNGIDSGEIIRPETVLFVPDSSTPKLSTTFSQVLMVIPAQSFDVPNSKRIFYKVVAGDSLPALSRIFEVSLDDLQNWNSLDSQAKLHANMSLQVYVPINFQANHIVYYDENRVQPVQVESETFFSHFEGLKGRTRYEIKIKKGDTWNSLSKKYDLSLGMLERINHRSRTSKLEENQTIIVYSSKKIASEGYGSHTNL